MKESWKIFKRSDGYVLVCSWNMISVYLTKKQLDDLFISLEKGESESWVVSQDPIDEFICVYCKMGFDMLLPKEEIKNLKETLTNFKEI